MNGVKLTQIYHDTEEIFEEALLRGVKKVPFDATAGTNKPEKHVRNGDDYSAHMVKLPAPGRGDCGAVLHALAKPVHTMNF